MGVLACDRRGCQNIMCDRIINSKKYICDTCYRQLLKNKDTWKNVTASDVEGLINMFMETGVNIHYEHTVDEAFDRLVLMRE